MSPLQQNSPGMVGSVDDSCQRVGPRVGRQERVHVQVVERGAQQLSETDAPFFYQL